MCVGGGGGGHKDMYLEKEDGVCWGTVARQLLVQCYNNVAACFYQTDFL